MPTEPPQAPTPFPTRDLRIDPNDVLQHPWNWEEIAEWQAHTRANFTPVVVVTGSPGPHARAQLMPPFGFMYQQPGHDEHPRYYSQLGRNHLPSAVSSVPMWMDVSKQYLQFIRDWENPQEKGWQNPVFSHPAVVKGRYFLYDDGYGKPTIGYGHLCKTFQDFPEGFTKQEVEDTLVANAREKAAGVRKVLKVGVSQQQFDALVDLPYSTILPNYYTMPVRALNAHTLVKQSDFVAYDHVGRTESLGLKKRRLAEWNMFLNGDYIRKP